MSAPILALPSTAMSVHAIDTSFKARKRIENIIIETDGANINQCHFNIHGDFCLNGNYQTIHSCHITTNNNGTGIKITNG
jgi:hypothetical protein